MKTKIIRGIALFGCNAGDEVNITIEQEPRQLFVFEKGTNNCFTEEFEENLPCERCGTIGSWDVDGNGVGLCYTHLRMAYDIVVSGRDMEIIQEEAEPEIITPAKAKEGVKCPRCSASATLIVKGG